MSKTKTEETADYSETMDECRPVDSAINNKAQPPAKEYGGPRGKEPTRYGDWEKNGRCIDF